MMGIKQFNQSSLKYFDYHWFWGLRSHRTEQTYNLLSDIQLWKCNLKVVSAVVDKQKKIDAYVAFFRFFYWLFNIHGYAANFYKLAAFYACGETGKDGRKMEAMSVRVFSFFKKIKGKLHSLFDVHEKAFPDSTHAKVEAQFPHAAVQEREDHVFEVNESMQPHLTKLGVSVVNQERLAWRLIREAYKTKAMETHPDRSGGQHNAFLAVKAAYDELHVQVFSSITNNQEDLIAKAYYERVARLSVQTAALAKDLNQIADEFSTIAHDQNRIAHDQNRIAHDQEESGRQLGVLMQGFEANGRAIEELRIQFEETDRLIEWFQAHTAAIPPQGLPESGRPVVEQEAPISSASPRSSSMQFFPAIKSLRAEVTDMTEVAFVDMSGLPYH